MQQENSVDVTTEARFVTSAILTKVFFMTPGTLTNNGNPFQGSNFPLEIIKLLLHLLLYCYYNYREQCVLDDLSLLNFYSRLHIIYLFVKVDDISTSILLYTSPNGLFISRAVSIGFGKFQGIYQKF